MAKYALLWTRRLAKTGLGLAAAAAILALTLETIDRFGATNPEQAWAQIGRDLRGEKLPLEQEAADLADEVERSTGIFGLRLVRIGLSDGLGGMDFAAQFNPSTFRISIDPKIATQPKAQRRSIFLHEIGHAIAFSTGAFPRANTGNEQANAIIENSLLSNQLFQESYADAFATLWALRANPADPVAWASIANAIAMPIAHLSPAHETSIALRLLKLRLNEARALPIDKIPDWLSSLSSQATALTIAQLGAEREAACHMGVRGMARFALDMGYESFYLPWEMSHTFPIASTDPMASGLATLAQLREKTAGKDAWADSLARARPAIEVALAAARNGANPEQASRLAIKGFALSAQNALPREISATALAAKLAATSRSGWRAKAARAALILSENILPTPTYGCTDLTSNGSLGELASDP